MAYVRRFLLAHPSVLVAVFLTTALAARPARAETDADPWRSTFAPSSVASYLPPVRQGCMVVAAGPEARAAANALVAALRTLPAARLVMDDAAIGSVAGLDDAAIVAKAARQPIDLVAVVRVFPGPSGEAERAVVTTYGKDATVAAAFTAVAGTPVEAKSADGPPGAGVGVSASSAVSRVLNAHPTETKSAAEEQYDASFISLGEVVAVTGNNVLYKTGTLTPTQGKYRKPLTWLELYTALELEDAIKRYHDAQATLKVVGVISLLGVIGGIAMFANGASKNCPDVTDPNYSQSCYDSQMLWTLGGGSLASIAIWPMLYGFIASPGNQVPDAELRQAVDQYNRGLRARLGLPPLASGEGTSGTSARLAAPRGRLGLVPVRLGDGAGLVLGGTF
jgi:hypothetical protein